MMIEDLQNETTQTGYFVRKYLDNLKRLIDYEQFNTKVKFLETGKSNLLD